MLILIDTREQRPWTFEGLGIETERTKLETGDYSLPGLTHSVCIERKSLDDWVGTVMRSRKRFYQELERMRAFRMRCVIIESSVREIMAERYKSSVSPKSVLGFIAEVAVGQSVPVYLGGTRAESQIFAAALLKQASAKVERQG